MLSLLLTLVWIFIGTYLSLEWFLGNYPALRLGTISPNAPMQWIWFPKSYKYNLSSKVYKHLINCSDDGDPWKGWKILWSLRMAPRAKHFIWMVFKGKLKAFDFLHALNIGPQEYCIFCGLNHETTEHLLNLCPKTQAIWNDVSNLVGKVVYFLTALHQIEADHSGYPNFVKAVVVAIA